MHCDSFPAQPFLALDKGRTPSAQECYQLWDQYRMLEHIRIHSQLVALVAAEITRLMHLKSERLQVHMQTVYAAGLLHDLAKTYTLKYGGNHSQIGAAWVLQHTNNLAMAQGVMHHVYWPGALDIEKHVLPLSLIYADKRVKHDRIVTLQERFADLLQRYGTTRIRVEMMHRSFAQVRNIEDLFNRTLEVDLNAYPFDSRGVVQ